MQLSIITAFDQNQLIGKENTLPWHLPEDLRYFKQTTQNATVVMGRKTFESIGRALPNRTNIVISSSIIQSPDITHIDCPDALFSLSLSTPIFIIGGASIYEHFLPHASHLYITHIDQTFSGDIYFPNISWDKWHKTSEKTADNSNIPHRYCIYKRLINE